VTSQSSGAEVSLGDQDLAFLLRTLDLRLTAFAVCEIGRGWRLKAGSMESTVVHFVLKGEGFFELAEGRVPLAPKSVLVVPPGTRKSITATVEVHNETTAAKSCRSLSEGLVSFNAHDGCPDLVLGCASISASFGKGQPLFDHLEQPVSLSVDGNRLSSLALDCLLQEVSSPGLATTAVIEVLMKQILVLLLRDHLHELSSDSPLFAPLADPRLVRALSLMIAHPDRPHTLDSLAAIAGMCRSNFARRFSEIYGRTPGDLLQEVRLRAAARMLGTCELPVKTVAARVGYSSRSHFSRAFKAAYGVDPTAFRGEARAGA
jgi:AraC-like DNA-binding protein